MLPDKKWSATSIHIFLNKLLDKGAIKVDGFVKTGKSYGRTYTAAITRDEFMVMQLKQSARYDQNESLAIPQIFSTLIDSKDIDADVILELEMILKKKKKELQ